MQFVKPISFEEALDLIGDKSAIGAMLSSSEWSDVPVALRLRAMFSANVENVRFLQRAQNTLGDFLDANKTDSPNGPMLATGSRAAFVQQLRDFAIAEGMGPIGGESGEGGGTNDLQDITSERRLGLIFDTLTRQAADYGYWRQGQDPDVLNEFPAQRFIRVLDVKEPRQSHMQYEDQVYLKNDPIWALRINMDFHVPWGPWGWGCGHDVEDVDREGAVSLGLLDEGEQVEPDVKNFNENLQASARGLDPDLLAKMKDTFGDQLVIDGDVMQWDDEVQSPMPKVQSPEAAELAVAGANDLESALAAHEDVLAKREGSEKLIVLDDQGKVLLERIGEKSSVPIFPDDAEHLQDAIVTHNHPMGRSFSDADLRTAAKFDVAEIRAVGVGQPYTYALKRPATGWPANIDRRYNEILNQVTDEFSAAILDGDMTQAEAVQSIHHEAMLRLAKELNLNYERIAR